MNCFRLSLLLATLTALSACAGGANCDSRKLYDSAQQAEPISIPDGLDGPEEYKELKIPEPAPRPPRAEGSGCLEAPPTLPVKAE